MIWLVVLPAILGCAVVLTDWAWRWMQDAVKPKPCEHPFWIFGRCIQCGTPM